MIEETSLQIGGGNLFVDVAVATFDLELHAVVGWSHGHIDGRLGSGRGDGYLLLCGEVSDGDFCDVGDSRIALVLELEFADGVLVLEGDATIGLGRVTVDDDGSVGGGYVELATEGGEATVLLSKEVAAQTAAVGSRCGIDEGDSLIVRCGRG